MFTVAIGMYEPRYALPALPLAAAAAALAVQGLIHRVPRESSSVGESEQPPEKAKSKS